VYFCFFWSVSYVHDFCPLSFVASHHTHYTSPAAAEQRSMEVDSHGVAAAAAEPVASLVPLVAADLQPPMPPSLPAPSGSIAWMNRGTPQNTDGSHTNRCSCDVCLNVCRRIHCASMRPSTPNLQRTAILRAVRSSSEPGSRQTLRVRIGLHMQ
jgi:hypothetical protein